MKTNTREERFSEFWQENNVLRDMHLCLPTKLLTAFITQELSQERKRLREIVKKKEIDIDGSGDLDYQGGYNEALDDILSELDNQGDR